MCGIAGIVNARLAPEEIQLALEHMQQAMLHRGPDEGGLRVFRDQQAGLCARRLAIVDLENGNQPIANEDETVFAVLNGEIYNHHNLRRTLLAHGHRFRGHSDTEVLVHLYELAGMDFLDQLRGMFALAIYDTRERRLIIARDGAGMKPLYLARTPRGFLFASEAKALFASGLVEPEPDLGAIDVYLASSFVPAKMSAFRGVEKLLPGQFLVVDPARESRGQFWQVRFRSSNPKRSDAGYAEELDALLRESVRSHLAADTPVGAFLSGGWDSSLTATLAAQAAGRNLKTFSVVFPDDPDADESQYSRLMARHLGTSHQEIEFRAGLLPELLPKLMRHLEEPCCNLPTGVMWVLASLGARHVKSALSGEGADELFGGYARFRDNYPYVIRRFAPRAPARALAEPCRPTVLRRALRFFGAPEDRIADAELLRVFTPADKGFLLRPEFRSDGPDLQPVLITPELLGSCQDTLQRRLGLEQTKRLSENILFNTDKMSMAHSLEVRMPFLDRSIIEFALGLPSRLKVRRGREKVILSALARRHLPAEIATRRKQGLAYPAGIWSQPPLNTFARELLLESNGPFNSTFLERHWRRGEAAARWLPVGCLVMLQVWWNEFIGNRVRMSSSAIAGMR